MDRCASSSILCGHKQFLLFKEPMQGTRLQVIVFFPAKEVRLEWERQLLEAAHEQGQVILMHVLLAWQYVSFLFNHFFLLF
jgi:hypothetical protein